MGKNFKAWPKEWPKTLDYPEVPVSVFLDQSADRIPHRIAIIFEGMELTYAELRDLSNRFASALNALGVRKGDRVAIHLPNCPQFAIAYYGILKIGAVFAPLSPHVVAREALFQLKDSGVETLISLDGLFPNIQSIIPETDVQRVITTGLADCQNDGNGLCKSGDKVEIPNTHDMVSLIESHETSPPDVLIDVHEDLAHIAYTGGTTGIPKGVMHSHHIVVASVLQNASWQNGAQIQESEGVLNQIFPPGTDPERDRLVCRDREKALVVVPWFHVFGCILYLNMHVYNGTTMIVHARFDPRKVLEDIVKYKISLVAGAPQLFIPLTNLPDFKSYDLSSIKLANLGAAPLPLPIFDCLLEAFSGVVTDAYGMTECTSGATVNPPDRSLLRPGSVGLPIFDTECRVVDPDNGKPLPVGEEGEICIRGPQVMKGYWGRPDETAAVLRDGWLLTGDIGREDEDGYFYITDRIKDMIIYKGYNVYPTELETVLSSHPAVQQCAVVGKPHGEFGELPIAFIELKTGESVAKESIMEFTNAQIAHYKKIRDVIFMDEIPVSPAGKILKKDLRKGLNHNQH